MPHPVSATSKTTQWSGTLLCCACDLRARLQAWELGVRLQWWASNHADGLAGGLACLLAGTLHNSLQAASTQCVSVRMRVHVRILGELLQASLAELLHQT